MFIQLLLRDYYSTLFRTRMNFHTFYCQNSSVISVHSVAPANKFLACIPGAAVHSCFETYSSFPILFFYVYSIPLMLLAVGVV